MKRWDQARAAQERGSRKLTVFAPVAGLATTGRITQAHTTPAGQMAKTCPTCGYSAEDGGMCFDCGDGRGGVGPAHTKHARAWLAQQRVQQAMERNKAAAAFTLPPNWARLGNSGFRHKSGALVQARMSRVPNDGETVWNWFPVNSFDCKAPKATIEEAMAYALGFCIEGNGKYWPSKNGRIVFHIGDWPSAREAALAALWHA